jgi:hypothetical protein
MLVPIFNGAIQYQPFDQTRISVTASRVISSSEYQNQVIENTSINADFNQRLFGGLYLDLSGSYTTTSYDATIIGLSTGRNDDTYTFNARLTCPFPKRGTVSIFYQYSNNSSSQTGFAAGASGFNQSEPSKLKWRKSPLISKSNRCVRKCHRHRSTVPSQPVPPNCGVSRWRR